MSIPRGRTYTAEKNGIERMYVYGEEYGVWAFYLENVNIGIIAYYYEDGHYKIRLTRNYTAYKCSTYCEAVILITTLHRLEL